MESLPEVETVLSKASDTAQDFSAKAAQMQALVSKRQQESTAALAAEKEAYEQNLTSMTAEIHAVEFQNKELQASIDMVAKESASIKKETERLRGENNIMRKTLGSLGGKVEAAEQFLDDSLVRTDDTSAEALKPLLPPVPEPSLSNFLSVMGDAQKDAQKSASLLQLSSHIRHIRSRGGGSKVKEQQAESESAEEMNPDALNMLLSESLADIEKEQKDGEAEMKAHFMKLHNASVTQLRALSEKKEALEKKLAESEDYKSSLLQAKAHIGATRSELLKRLHGMDVFAKKVDDAAANALESVEATIASLSEVPALPQPTAQVSLRGSQRSAVKRLAK